MPLGNVSETTRNARGIYIVAYINFDNEITALRHLEQVRTTITSLRQSQDTSETWKHSPSLAGRWIPDYQRDELFGDDIHLEGLYIARKTYNSEVI